MFYNKIKQSIEYDNYNYGIIENKLFVAFIILRNIIQWIT